MRKTIFLDKDISVLIVSAGGVGTTFLIKEIGKYLPTNCANNKDGYKHIPIPPISRNKHLKVIYVFGNPIHACISLFRRQYHHTQSVVVQKFLKNKYLIPFQTKLEPYALDGKDGLLFEQHFNNWKSHYPFYPSLFVKYENLFDSIEEIASFLNLPKAFVGNFPSKKTRKSNINDLSKAVQIGLNGMYGSFQDQVHAMDNCIMVSAQKSVFNIKILFSPLYRQALKDAFLTKFPLLRKLLNSIYL